jgi:hypothetical protein
MRTMETPEMHFFKRVAGYRMRTLEKNQEMRDINKIIINYQEEWLEPNPKAAVPIQTHVQKPFWDVQRNCRRNSFNIRVSRFSYTSLLGNGVAYSRRNLPTFRRNAPPPFLVLVVPAGNSEKFVTLWGTW